MQRSGGFPLVIYSDEEHTTAVDQSNSDLDNDRLIDALIDPLAGYRSIEYLEGLDPDDLPANSPDMILGEGIGSQPPSSYFTYRRMPVLQDLMEGSTSDTDILSLNAGSLPESSPPPYDPPEGEIHNGRARTVNITMNNGGIIPLQHEQGSEPRDSTLQTAVPVLIVDHNNMPSRSRSSDRNDQNRAAEIDTFDPEPPTVIHTYRDVPQNTPEVLQSQIKDLRLQLSNSNSQIYRAKCENEQLRGELRDRDNTISIIEGWVATAHRERDEVRHTLRMREPRRVNRRRRS